MGGDGGLGALGRWQVVGMLLESHEVRQIDAPVTHRPWARSTSPPASVKHRSATIWWDVQVGEAGRVAAGEGVSDGLIAVGGVGEGLCLGEDLEEGGQGDGEVLDKIDIYTRGKKSEPEGGARAGLP